jgi:hypothetical protein
LTHRRYHFRLSHLLLPLLMLKMANVPEGQNTPLFNIVKYSDMLNQKLCRPSRALTLCDLYPGLTPLSAKIRRPSVLPNSPSGDLAGAALREVPAKSDPSFQDSRVNPKSYLPLFAAGVTARTPLSISIGYVGHADKRGYPQGKKDSPRRRSASSTKATNSFP